MRIAIAGWFGSDNLGDELLLRSLMGCVRAVDPAATFVVLAPDPERVAELHGVDAVPMPTLRGGGGAAGRQALVRRALKECDLLFLGPGTVFQERSPNLRWPGTLALFTRLVGMARSAGTPVATAGVGVREGGTPAGNLMLRGIGAACVAVGVRDKHSAAPFGRKAQVIGDLAYTMDLPALDGPAPGQRFAVSMRPLAPAVEQSLLTAISGCVDRLRGQGWSGDFLPMAFGRGARGEDDRDVYDRGLRDSLDLAGNPLGAGGPLSFDGWLRELAGYRLTLSTRLHAAVPAVALGVPTVAIAYEQKVHGVFVDLGLSRFVVPPDVTAEALHRTATEALAAPGEFQQAAKRLAAQGGVAREFVAATLRGLG